MLAYIHAKCFWATTSIKFYTYHPSTNLFSFRVNFLSRDLKFVVFLWLVLLFFLLLLLFLFLSFLFRFVSFCVIFIWVNNPYFPKCQYKNYIEPKTSSNLQRLKYWIKVTNKSWLLKIKNLSKTNVKPKQKTRYQISSTRSLTKNIALRKYIIFTWILTKQFLFFMFHWLIQLQPLRKRRQSSSFLAFPWFYQFILNIIS